MDSGMPGNEAAHEDARNLVYRAPQPPSDTLPDETADDTAETQTLHMEKSYIPL